MAYPRVAMVMLNWNGWQDAIESLESLYQISYPAYDVILVDNGSQDGSVEKIKEWAAGRIPASGKFCQYDPAGKPVTMLEYERPEAEAGGGREKSIADLPSRRKLIIIKNEQNLGITRATNLGMAYALKALSPDWLLLLHNDISFAPDFLDEMIAVARREPRAGIMSAMIFHYREPEKIWSAGGRINSWLSPFAIKGEKVSRLARLTEAAEMDFVFGGATMISREVLTTVGLLDEAFFFSTEELDICIRTRRQGFKVFLVPKSKIWHKISISGTADAKRRLDYYHQYTIPGLFTLMKKHWKGLHLWTATLSFFLDRLVGLLLLPVRTREWSEVWKYPGAVLDYLKKQASRPTAPPGK